MLNRTFETNVTPLADQALQFEQSCRSDPSSSAFTPAQLDARTAACQLSLAAGPLFRTKYGAIQAGLQHWSRSTPRSMDVNRTPGSRLQAAVKVLPQLCSVDGSRACAKERKTHISVTDHRGRSGQAQHERPGATAVHLRRQWPSSGADRRPQTSPAAVSQEFQAERP